MMKCALGHCFKYILQSFYLTRDELLSELTIFNRFRGKIYGDCSGLVLARLGIYVETTADV